MTRKCVCGKTFAVTAKTRTKRFCSRVCSSRNFHKLLALPPKEKN